MKHEPILTIAATGLLTGCVLGMIGAFVPSDVVRNVLWAIDSSGLILAAALLTLYFFRKGNDIVAAGFLVFAIAESIIFFSCAGALTESIPAFGTGTCLWALSIAVISSQRVFPWFVRGTGILSALLFVIVAFLIFTGHSMTALTQPLPFFAYPFYAATLAGWAWTLWYRKHTFINVT
ncbi:hypothetical protein [Larkinella rosea]|uniref:Uncharacterized protein n=1 Tax=Larkinella rosea TaxID=2025312 RepID=A0A3P1BFT3_9BACT|nr:hypothetical protein [Larkinella rosea]RRA99930.1 hypothetical protein EHT25_25195 [Larkinella rosea]